MDRDSPITGREQTEPLQEFGEWKTGLEGKESQKNLEAKAGSIPHGLFRSYGATERASSYREEASSFTERSEIAIKLLERRLIVHWYVLPQQRDLNSRGFGRPARYLG